MKMCVLHTPLEMSTAPNELSGEALWSYLRNESIEYQQNTGAWPESTQYDFKFHFLLRVPD